MGKYSVLMIFIASSLLIVLQNVEIVNAVGCTGSFFNGNSSYAQNRRDLFSTLPNKVVTNGGFYNSSLGKSPNIVHAVALCGRGYEQQACIRCVDSAIQGILTTTSCLNRVDSFTWDKDEEDNVSCLVSTSNHSTFGNLELRPSVRYQIPNSIEPSKNMTLFEQEWNAMANRTVESATEAETSSVLKYYSAEKAEFTEFPNVYMLMQCTPDITSQDCKTCLGECVTLFKEQVWGRQGGEVYRPSCFFRWDLYAFHGAFDNVTRVPAPPRPQAQGNESSITKKKGRSIGYGGIIAIVVVLTFINILVFIGYIKVYGRRKESYNKINVGSAEYSDSDGQFMLRFDLGMVLAATDEFSSENTLGQGGFGTVYKGTLLNGQEVAVKRLTKGSGQGDIEFKNEVSLLTRLQHRNLVKLLGFCNEGDEQILVYEFVPNSSLDHFIFDDEKRSLLTWEMRYRIIEGIARGLLYLHEDSQLKIIHRDLKASNILLDAEMNPKVADFGTARLFDSDETRAETKRIAGTRGYMAPEYLNHGQISAKSDVYSFGVMLLEMISGERNNSFEGEGLAAFAWKRWVEGKPEIIIDPFLIEKPRNEIIKLIQIGLLCVQENPTKRPTMSSVIIWLGSETIIIPLPKAPAFTGSRSQSEIGAMSMSDDVFTELSCRTDIEAPLPFTYSDIDVAFVRRDQGQKYFLANSLLLALLATSLTADQKTTAEDYFGSGLLFTLGNSSTWTSLMARVLSLGLSDVPSSMKTSTTHGDSLFRVTNPSQKPMFYLFTASAANNVNSFLPTNLITSREHNSSQIYPSALINCCTLFPPWSAITKLGFHLKGFVPRFGTLTRVKPKPNNVIFRSVSICTLIIFGRHYALDGRRLHLRTNSSSLIWINKYLLRTLAYDS
ncbi:Gnk2-homologous domain [Arabidopsis suecica]|uniref:Gnk2-homologous domain n=1 Tax=Arabidopsis suecica TaxID=45249 RepID=A0A8T2EBZ6_ARASU|nr:Gnk2-homologous domain [Arabidopsis suecica]